MMSLLVVNGCQEPVGGMGRSPVFLTAQPQDTWAVLSDVYDATYTGKTTFDTHWVTITSTYKNPSLASTFADVYLSEYRVTYYRLDGSTKVPDPFTVQFTGVVPAGGTLDHETVVVTKEAKLKPPLRELAFGGGEGIIYMNAVIEYFGEDLMGNKVSVKYVLPIQAADW